MVTSKRVLAAALVIAVLTGNLAWSQTSEPTVAEIRAATSRFKDVAVALAEGYVPDPSGHCESAESMGKPAKLGSMGVHYFRPDLLGISGPPNPRVDGTGVHTDFRQPGVLIYEPQPDGGMVLVAVENLVFEKAWKASGKGERPTLHGQAYDHMVDDPSTPTDEAHMFAPHYDRHVWAHRDNPNGVYAQYNPNVTCKHARPVGPHIASASSHAAL